MKKRIKFKCKVRNLLQKIKETYGGGEAGAPVPILRSGDHF
jgi:hypothetical protein